MERDDRLFLDGGDIPDDQKWCSGCGMPVEWRDDRLECINCGQVFQIRKETL